MRAERERISLLEKAGADESDVIAARAKYRVTSSEYTRFSKAMDLPQQRERITVDGLGNIGVGKVKVDKSVNSGIISNRGFTKITDSGRIVNPMDEEKYKKIKANLEKTGCSVIAARGDDEKFLKALGAEAISDEHGIMHLGDVPSASAFFEEIIHYTQMKKYGVVSEIDFAERAAREVAANRKLLKNGKAYGFTREDFADIESNLRFWEQDFLKKVGVTYDESNLKRDI